MCDNAECVYISDSLVIYPVHSLDKWISHLDIRE